MLDLVGGTPHTHMVAKEANLTIYLIRDIATKNVTKHEGKKQEA